MLQYFINTTAIWLISLVLFDLFLRRESYHTYNRFFLLATFVLGLVLPMVQWQSFEYLQPALQQPVYKIIDAKHAIAVTTSASSLPDWEWWAGIIYAIGVVAAIVLLMTDIVKLIVYYNTGTRSQQGSWTIIATGKDHAPFSFRKLLFIGTREQYSDEEWSMLFVHESEHTRQLHIADLLLMQAARIVLWFHPLVYVYNKRLLLVHEYQADTLPSAQPTIYGQFLIEQAILMSAPNLSHSFNRSPIKNRIIMLTRKSTNASRTKMLVFIPIALVSIFCFSQNGFSQRFQRKGNMVTYNGNTFEMAKEQRDTVEIEDPVTGQRSIRVVVVDPQPKSMNGKAIPERDNTVTPPGYEGEYKNLRGYLLKKLKPELTKLGNGAYTLDITNVVVDEKGRIVYFDYSNMRRSEITDGVNPMLRQPGSNPTPNAVAPGNQSISLRASNARTLEIDKTSQQKIFEQVCKVMNEAKVYRSAIKDGKPVVAVVVPMEFYSQFKVEHHKLYDMDKTGTWQEL